MLAAVILTGTGTVRYGTGIVPYCTVRYGTIGYNSRTVRKCATVQHPRTVRYRTVRHRYSTVQHSEINAAAETSDQLSTPHLLIMTRGILLAVTLSLSTDTPSSFVVPLHPKVNENVSIWQGSTALSRASTASCFFSFLLLHLFLKQSANFCNTSRFLQYFLRHGDQLLALD